jgi:hypothetical protein
MQFDMDFYLPTPDGGEDLRVVTCDVDLETLEVVGTVDGVEVELCELQIEQALFVASERIDYAGTYRVRARHEAAQ